MAETNILSISLKDYKKQIEDLISSLLLLEKDSEKYTQVVNEIQDRQKKLNEVLSDTKKQNTALEGSYNAISKQLSELRKEYKATNDEAKRQELAPQMNALNDQLKAMDANVGVFNRNVGNYANSFQAALGGMGIGLDKLKDSFDVAVNGGTSLDASFKALALNPWMAVISILVAILMKVIEKIKGSEEMSNRLGKAFSALKPIMDVLNKALTLLADGLVKLIELWTGAVSKVLSLSSAYRESAKAAENAAIAEQKYAEITQQSEAELDRIATQRLANEVALTKATGKEKQKLIAQNRELLRSELALQVEIAKSAYLAARSKVLASSGEEAKKADAEREKAYQEFVRSQLNYKKGLMDFDAKVTADNAKQNSSRASSTSSSLKKQEDRWKEYVDSVNKELERIGNEGTQKVNDSNFINDKLKAMGMLTPDDVRANNEEVFNAQNDAIKNQIALLEQSISTEGLGNEQKSELEKQLLDKKAELNTLYQEREIQRIQEQNDRLKEEYDRNIQNLNDSYNATKFGNDINLTNDFTGLNEMYLNQEITLEEYYKRIEELQAEHNQIEYEEEIKHIDDLIAEKQRLLDSIAESSEAYMQLSSEITTLERDKEKTISENNKKESEKRVKQQNETKKKGASYKDMLGSYSSFSSAMQNLMGKESAAGKAFAISDAIVATYQGVAGIMQNRASYAPPFGNVLYYTDIATQIATGLANVKNILSESTSGGGSTGNAVQASALSSAVVSPLLNNAQDMMQLTSIDPTLSDVKVYVVEEDITNAQNTVKTRVTESTF